MGGEGESSKPIEAAVARDVVRRHSFELKLSPEFARERERSRMLTLSRAKEEHRLKLREGVDLLSLRVQLATLEGDQTQELPPDDESCCLNNEERNAYCETIDKCVDDKATTQEDKEAVRRDLTDVIFRPKVFLIHYKRWKSAWDDSPALQKKFPEFKDYVFDRAKAFILAQSYRMADSRVRKFQEDHLSKSASPEAQKDRLKEIQKKTRRFMKVHQAEILAYVTLDESDPKRQLLFQRFIAETGIQGADIQAARKLFEEIIDDVGAAFAAIKKLEASSDKMVAKAKKALDENTEIDEDEWNKMLEDSLKEDPFFKEVMQQQQAVVYQAEPDVAPRMSLDSPQAVALQAGGLILLSYDERTNTGVVRYPNSTLQITMQIVPKKGSKNFDDATFIFSDEHADKAKGKRVTLDRGNLRSGCNRIFLDYLMYELFRQNKVSPDFNPNDILNDATMVRMAERLYGRSLNDVVFTTPNMRSVFTRFLMVVMKGDSPTSAYGNLGSFQSRVKMMDVVLMNPNYAKKLYREFEKDGSTAFTLSTLLERVGYKG
jgi:hypothetical protein